MRPSSLLLCTVLLLTGSACSTDPSDSAASHEEPDIEVTEPHLDGDYSLPLDTYVGDFEERLAFANARERLIGDCFARFGSPWTPVSYQEPGYSRGVALSGDWYTLDHAREYGYDKTDELLQEFDMAIFGPDGAWRAEGGLSDDELTLLHGDPEAQPPHTEPIPEGGCLGEANRALGWDSDDIPLYEFVDGLAAEADTRMHADSRVAEVTSQWSECMGERGYHYDDLWEPERDPQWGAEDASGAERRTSAEIDTAVADVECRQDTNVGGVRLAVTRAYEQELLEENLAALGEAQDEVGRTIDNAHEMLGGTGGR